MLAPIDQARARPTRSQRHRRGISLLEVLVSMFILLIGLLSIAAMFPVGRYYMTRATRYDRAAAVGQKAISDLQARALLQPDRWVRKNGSPIPPPDVLLPAAIDPIGCAYTGSDAVAGKLDWFPYGTGPTTGIRRVTYAGPSGTMSKAVADEVFGAGIDLAVNFHPSTAPAVADSDKPSVQIIDSNKRQTDGHYTWMYTAVPQPEWGDDVYLVTVVVFYKRNPAQEWFCVVPVYSSPSTNYVLGGNGGGRIRLTANQGAVDIRHQLERLSSLTEGEWLMLYYPPSSPGGTFWLGWYRIVGTGLINTSSSPPERYVDVAGADFPDLNRTKFTVDPTVGVFDSAVAVYQRMMRIHRESMWGWE